VFLSTHSNLPRFAPTKTLFYSDRVIGHGKFDPIQIPITETPFDVWYDSEIQGIVAEDTTTLNEACKIEFMARFGRPL
jgi:hypothetical protein